MLLGLLGLHSTLYDLLAFTSPGVSGDVHALRGQLASANERLAAVDAMAERVAVLRTSLAAITAAANWGASRS